VPRTSRYRSSRGDSPSRLCWCSGRCSGPSRTSGAPWCARTRKYASSACQNLVYTRVKWIPIENKNWEFLSFSSSSYTILHNKYRWNFLDAIFSKTNLFWMVPKKLKTKYISPLVDEKAILVLLTQMAGVSKRFWTLTALVWKNCFKHEVSLLVHEVDISPYQLSKRMNRLKRPNLTWIAKMSFMTNQKKGLKFTMFESKVYYGVWEVDIWHRNHEMRYSRLWTRTKGIWGLFWLSSLWSGMTFSQFTLKDPVASENTYTILSVRFLILVTTRPSSFDWPTMSGVLSSSGSLPGVAPGNAKGFSASKSIASGSFDALQ